MSRQERVAALIKSDISEILRREVNDPRIGFVSITDVEIGSDLMLAKVFVSILGSNKEKKDTMSGLECATNHIRHELGKRLEMKSVPEIVFREDPSIERGSRIFAIMNKLELKIEKPKKKAKK